jgi:hypothetical protein
MDKTFSLLMTLLTGVTIFTGCSAFKSESNAIDQSKLCIFSDDDGAKKCKNGETLFFSPQNWGNEQLPLNVAALYCDTNYQIMYNNAGVVCIFTDKRLQLSE